MNIAFLRLDSRLILTSLLLFLLNIIPSHSLLAGDSTGIRTYTRPTAIGISPSTNQTKCQGESVTFSVTGSAAGDEFQWKRNGANIPGATSSSYVANQTGDYSCTVTSSTNNTTTTAEVTLTINPLPNVTITASDVRFCTGGSATLTPGGANSYVWTTASNLSVNNTTNVATVNPPNTGGSSLNFNYSVEGTGSNGCKKTVSVTITVDPLPAVPSISTNPNPPVCSGTPITFSTTAVTGQTYLWDFDDTSPNGTGISVSHPFTTNVGNGNQDYSVRLTTTITATGCKRDATQTVRIKQRPDANLTDTVNTPPFTVCGGASSSIVVSNRSTTNNINYTINWGDNVRENFTSPLSVATHTYPRDGYFNMVFSVTGSNGCKDSSRYEVFFGTNPAIPFTNPGQSTNVCLPFTITIPRDPSVVNTPGTAFIMSPNDGARADTLYAPLTTNYTHTFTQSSCGFGAPITNNAFFINITAKNACDTNGSRLIILPITTVAKPKANFSILPDTINCVGNNMTFTNTSIRGKASNCDSTSQVRWVITPGIPGTDYTIVSGGGVNTWITYTNPLVLNFNTPNTYQIKMNIRTQSVSPTGTSALCREDSIVKTICINPLPTASFTQVPDSGCTPLNVNLSGITNTLNCGKNAFKYSVSYIPANRCQPDTSNFSFTNGTRDTSQNPRLTFVSPGQYIISVQTFAPNSRCSSAIFRDTIKVKSKPQISVNSLAEICAGKSVNPRGDTLHCSDNITAINWTFTGGTPSSATAFSPGTITYTNTGSFPIKLTATNSCGSASDEKTLVVNPLPTITGGNSVCVGKSLQLTGSATPATTNAWVSSDPTKASIDANGLVTGISDGTITITYTNNKGCQQTLTLNVLPKPTISGPLSLCKGSTTSLTGSAPVPSGNPWSSSDNNIASINSAGLVTGVNNGSATLLYTNGNGCTQNEIVAVFALPTITADDKICIGSTKTISGSGTPASSSAWTSSTTNIAITGSGVNANITGNIVGNSVITYTDNNGCKQTKTIDVKALPVISNVGPVCVNNSITLSGSPSAASTNPWVSSQTSVATVNGSGVVSALSSGTVSITYEDLNGCKKSESITVNPLPVINGADNVCKGATISLTGDGTPASPTAWNSSNTSIASIDNSGLVSGINTGSADITYTNTNGCKRIRTIQVKPVPSITVSSINPTACGATNGSITISGLSPNSSYTLNYTVGGSAVSPIAFNTGTGVTTYTISNLAAGSYNPINVTLNGCKSNDASASLSNPTAPATPTITPIDPICSGNSFTLSISNTTTGVTYNWSGPVSASSTPNTSFTVNNATTAASGIYTVTATKDGCVSAAGNATVTVNPTPGEPGAVTPIKYCQGNTPAILAATPDGSNTLVWYSVASGGTPLTSAPTPTTSSTGTQSFYVSQKTATCEGSRKKIDVIVNVTPAAPSVSDYQVCQFRTATALTATLADASYTAVWYSVSNGGTALSGAPTPTTTATGTTTFYVSQRTTEGCEGPRAAITATVKPTPLKPTVTTPVSICEDVTTTALTATADGSNVLKWYENATGGVALSGAPTPNTADAGQQDFYVTQTNGDFCESDRAEIIVNIKQAPAAPVVITPISLCENSIANALSATALNNHTLQWFLGNTALTGAPTPTTTTTGTTTYSVQQTNTTNGCTGPKANISVEVKPTPIITGTDKTNPNNCNTATGSITINGLTSGQSYTVHIRTPTNNDSTFNATANSQGKIIVGNLVSGSYQNIYVVLSGCSSNTVGPITLSDPNPPAAPSISSNSPICSGKTLELRSNSTEPGTQSYQWSGPNGFSSVLQNPDVTNASTVASGTYLVTLTINSCKSQPSSVVVKVDSTPVAPILSSNTPVCSDNDIRLTATTSSTMPVAWSWTGPGSFTSTDQNPVRTGATESMEGDYKATATASYPANNQSCKSAESTTNVVVNPTPKITTTSSDGPTNCNTATGKITLNGLSNNTPYQVRFITPSGNDTTINITSNGSGQVIITGLRAGSYSNIRVVLTNCPSNTVGPIILSDPNPPSAPIATSNTPICQNQALQFNITTPIAGGVYEWTGPLSYQASGISPNIPTAQPNRSGNYFVTVTLNDCKSPSTTVPVIVHPNPSEPVSDDLTYCQFVVATSMVATPNTNHTIRWYDASGNSLSTAPTPPTDQATTLNYQVSQVSPEGCEGPKNQVSVLVRPTPSIPSPQQTSVCTSTPFIITPTGLGVPSGTTYSWSIPTVSDVQLTNGSAGTDQPNINGTLNNATDINQTATYRVVPKTPFCTGVEFNAIVTVKPAPRVNFSPTNQTLCSGTQTASVSLTSPTPDVSLPWTATIPAAISGATASGSNTINAFIPTNNSSSSLIITYSSTATTTPTAGGSGCSGTPSTYTITVNPRPKIADNTLTFCSRESWKYAPVDQAPSQIVPVGTQYTWEVLSNPNIEGATNQTTPTDSLRQRLRNLTNTPQVIRYKITPKSGDCTGADFILTVTINPTPEVQAQSETICSGNSFSITPSNNPTASIIPSGTTYSWNTPITPSGVTGAIAGIGANSISGTLSNTTFAPLGLTYRVMPKSGAAGACIGDSFNVVITINPRSSISNNPVKQTICTNQSSASVTWESFTSGATYSWRLSYSGSVTGFLSDGNGPLLGAMTLQNNGNTPDSLIYLVSSTASDCSGPPTPYIIVVNPDAKALFGYTADTACWPFSLSITNTSPRWSLNQNVPNGSYNWYQVNQGGSSTLINSGLNFNGYTIPGPSDSVEIKLEAISFFGCLNSSTSHRFFTRPKPSSNFNLFNQDSCGPRFIRFTNLTNLKDTFNYQWTFGNGQSSSLSDPVDVRYDISPAYVDTTYLVKLIASNECDRSEKLDSVIVRTSPKARFAVSASAGCSPFTIQIQNTSLGNPTTYYWDYGNGIKDTTNNASNFRYTYTTGQVDTFELMLIAESDCGRDTQIIEIKVAPNVIRPGISINASELYGCVNHRVNFINTTFGATQFRWNFGDGSPIQTTNIFQNPVNHIYTTAGTFDVRIDMTNGCSDTFVTKQIVVYPGPDAQFNIPTSICFGDTLKPVNQSINASNYFWSFGNGITSSLQSPQHLYLSPGLYNVSLQAVQTSPQGQVCFDTISRTLTVVAKPDTGLTTNIGAINCSPFRLTGNFSGYTNETVTWFVYDTTLPSFPVVLNGPLFDYTFNRSGQFKVVALIENASGCKDSTSRTLIVYAKPQASFSPLNIGTCSLDTTIAYQNQTTANIYTPLRFRWYVDDVLRSSNGNYTHRYVSGPTTPLPREFKTKLVAINSVGCADSITGTLTMYPTAKSRFTVNNTTSCLPFVANIINTSTYAAENRWYLNDSLVSTDPNPTILIRNANTSYTIKHVVSSGYACNADSTTQTFRTRIMPIARFSLADTLGCNGQLNVRPVNNSQFATSYQWNWGDGSPINTQINPSYLYRNIGTFRVTLTAKDVFCQDTISRLVNVSVKPVVDFQSSLTRSCDTTTLQLINLTANATLYSWSLNSNVVSNEFSPLVTIDPSNTPYTVTLVATNAAGCKDSLTKANYIQIIPPPAADFYVTPSQVISIPNYSFGFTNLTPNLGYYLYNWSMGDNSFYDTRDVDRHQYSDTGKYEVTLAVTDTMTNCRKVVKKIVQIVGQPGYLYVPNAFFPNSRQLEFQTFKPNGKGLKEYQLQIFDSWGKLLFMTDKLDAAGRPIEAWDGTFKGKPMPQDAYAWRIKARFRNGLVWEGMQYDQKNKDKPGQTFGTVTLFR